MAAVANAAEPPSSNDAKTGLPNPPVVDVDVILVTPVNA